MLINRLTGKKSYEKHEHVHPPRQLNHNKGATIDHNKGATIDQGATFDHNKGATIDHNKGATIDHNKGATIDSPQLAEVVAVDARRGINAI